MQIDKLKLQIAMARCKMNNTNLAKATGLSRSCICNVQREGAKCKVENVGLIAEALNCDVTDIILMQE